MPVCIPPFHFAVFAVLHIPDFPLHAVLRLEPGASSRPAALFATANKKSILLALNSTASAHGVELGMTAPQAVARCPALLIRTPQPDAEQEARSLLLALGFTLSPHLEDTAPGVCTIDLGGLDPAQHEPRASAAVEELCRLDLPATCGIAATPLLALQAARHLTHQRKGMKRVRTVRDARAFLAPLELATIEPSAELAGVLASWGLHTLGDLVALPRDEIVRRFGREGLTLWQRAHGGETRPLRRVVPAQQFTAATEFEHEIETLEPLLFVLRRFLDRLALELRASQHVAAEIFLSLRLEDETRHERAFRLPEPTADVEILFRTLHTHLESLQTASCICALELRLTPARPLVRQQGLFDTGLRDPHGFAETLARVGAIVGADRAGTPHVPDTHRPDAVQLTEPAPVVLPAAEPPLHATHGLTLRRFRPPLAVHLEFTHGRASFLWSDGPRGEISFHGPPYESSGEWWQRDRAWSRTGWDIGLASGGLYRLLRIDQAYFLEGEYD